MAGYEQNMYIPNDEADLTLSEALQGVGEHYRAELSGFTQNRPGITENMPSELAESHYNFFTDVMEAAGVAFGD